MEKTNFKSVSLVKGEVHVYDFGEIKLHAYKTNDLIDDEVFVLEKSGNGVCLNFRVSLIISKNSLIIFQTQKSN